MTDLRSTVAPKSDQLNSDDLIGQTMTVRVTKVSLLAEADQPIAINFDGDGGKPYKPCKSMRRVLIIVWGDDGNKYIGRSMTLYRDEKVMFGGLAVGGIRISHMSDIEGPVTMALTATRASRKPYTVRPLMVPEVAPQPATPAASPEAIAAAVAQCEAAAKLSTPSALGLVWNGLSREIRAVIGAEQLAAWKARIEANAKDETS